MIIDTDTPEGRALVALAKFGKWALLANPWDVYLQREADDKAEYFGLLAPVRVGNRKFCPWKECCCIPHDLCLRPTDLAKLPEGL